MNVPFEIDKFDLVKQAILLKSNVRPEELEARSRKERLRDARNMVCGILFYWEKMTQEEIGKLLGNRERTTILGALKTHTNLLESDAAYRLKYLQIMGVLYPDLDARSIINYECGDGVGNKLV